MGEVGQQFAKEPKICIYVRGRHRDLMLPIPTPLSAAHALPDDTFLGKPTHRQARNPQTG